MIKRWVETWRQNPAKDPRGSIINLFTYTAMMALFIQIQVVVKKQTDNNFLVGLVTASFHLMYFLSGLFFGRLGDFIKRRMIIVSGCLIAATGAVIMGLVNSFPAILAARALTGLGVGMLPGALFASTIERKGSVGLLSALGSLGWAIGSFGAAWLGPRPVTFFVAAGFLALPSLLGLSFREAPQRPKSKFFSLAILKKHWSIFLGFFLRHAGAMSIWVTFTLFLKEIGADKPVIPGLAFFSLIGLIYAINPLSQFFFMLIIGKIKPKISLPLGYIFSSVVFFGYVVVAILAKTAIIANPYLIIPLQIILAFTWATLYLGSLLYLNKHSSEERSTLSGAFSAVMGLCGIAGSLLGGLLSSLSWKLTIAGQHITLSYEISMLAGGLSALLGLGVMLLGTRGSFSKNS